MKRGMEVIKNWWGQPHPLLGEMMSKYKLWVRIKDFQTVETIIWANNDYDAKLLGEAQFGVGNVLSYTKVD